MKPRIDLADAMKAVVHAVLPYLSTREALLAMTLGIERRQKSRSNEVFLKSHSEKMDVTVCWGFSRIEGDVLYPLIAFSDVPQTHRNINVWRVLPCSENEWVDRVEPAFSEIRDYFGFDEETPFFFRAEPELLRVKGVCKDTKFFIT